MAEGMEIIRRITPEEEYNAGLVIFRQGGVHPLEDENGFLRYAVDGDPRRIVRVGATTKLSGRCSCDFFGNVHKPCRHLAAAMMQAISTGAIEEMRRRRARENAGALMGTLQSALPMETPLEMEITLRLLGEREPVRVSLRVGQERMYVVKSMAQFLRGLQEKTAIAFGKGFVLEPEWMGFTGRGLRLPAGRQACSDRTGREIPDRGGSLRAPADAAPDGAPVQNLLRRGSRQRAERV